MRQVGKRIAQVQHLRTHGLLAREGQKLPHEAGCTVGVLLDVHDVLEGRVRVDDAEAIQDRGAIITAGDIAMSRGTSTLITRQADKKVDAALAWREGLLTFDQAPLAQVVAEFNRYNGSRLVVTDAEAARIPIGGSFQASSADSFVRLLHDAYGLRIERDDNMVRISSP